MHPGMAGPRPAESNTAPPPTNSTVELGRLSVTRGDSSCTTTSKDRLGGGTEKARGAWEDANPPPLGPLEVKPALRDPPSGSRGNL